jgi:ABC-type multidrug transport system fused ATPase/permease subunit
VIIFSSALPVIAIQASADIINNIVSETDHANIHISIIQWGVALLLYDFVSPLIAFLQSNLGDKAVFYINRSVINKSNSLLGLEHFDNAEFYDDLQIISTNAANKPINLVVTLIGILKDFCLIVYCLGLLFWNISLLSLLVLVCIIFHTRVSTRIQSEMWNESLGRSKRSRFMNYIASLSVNHAYIKEIRLFALGKYLYKKYINIFEEIYSSMFRLRLKLILFAILPAVFLLIGNVFALNEAIKLIIDGTLKIGVISIIIQCFMQLHTSVLSLGEQGGWLVGHLLFFEKYFNFLDKPKNDFYNTNTKLLIGGDYKIQSIRFDNVSFTYSDGRKALENINFEITENDRLAIVGANGSGKTTLIKLLCGFYKPTSGKILINNIPMQNYNIEHFREKIAPIFQDFSTYTLTVAENITMGRPLDEGIINDIFKDAQMSFVKKLPDKIHQQLGKDFDGTDLSIGQWQRIAIGRAIYKGGDLYILDEPSASLDPISENEIFEHFDKLSRNKMTVFITHRLTAIYISNKVLFLDQGRQQGFAPHEKLLFQSTMYKKMFDSQASRFLSLANCKPTKK